MAGGVEEDRRCQTKDIRFQTLTLRLRLMNVNGEFALQVNGEFLSRFRLRSVNGQFYHTIEM